VTKITEAPVTNDDVREGSSQPAGLTRSFAKSLAVVAAIGLVVRVLNVLWWRPTTDRLGFTGYRLGGDAWYYHMQANAMAAGKFFIDPVAYHFFRLERPSAVHPPLYSLYLSFWSRLGVDSVTGHRLVSGLLGVGVIVTIGLLGRRIAGPKVGLIAAAITAVYPFMWINDGMLMSESLVVLASAFVLYAAYSFAGSPSTRTAVVLGVACGAAALGRSELTLLFPILVLPLAACVRRESWKHRIKLATVTCVVGALVLLPWITLNILRFEEPVLLSTGTGSVLSAASCDETYYGRNIGYWAYCFQGPWPRNTLDESQRDLAPGQDAIDYIKTHKSRLPLVVAARIGRMWSFFKPGQTTAFEWALEGRGRAPSWAALFSYYALLPFAGIGLIVMRRRELTIWPPVALAICVTIAAAVTFGLARYRAPAEVGLVLVAAVGLEAAWRRRHARQPPVDVDA
jgi:4-amino-4-deoxy-L-arabinose transferase-like glycosyltransferase